MITKIKKNILLYIYRKLIYRVTIIDKIKITNIVNSIDIKEFSRLEINTSAGPFTFIFKEDRRSRKRNKDSIYITSFLVEIIVPHEANEIIKEAQNKILVVVKLTLFKPNYKILSELLLDLYLDKFLLYFKDKDLIPVVEIN
ncbi:MAG: hypothetical protein ACD_33C00041G0002 [uncultured bacterium]|nr:MAG: hypothetical protein ACD_33C00041G0002 [uncultured bacterium]